MLRYCTGPCRQFSLRSTLAFELLDCERITGVPVGVGDPRRRLAAGPVGAQFGASDRDTGDAIGLGWQPCSSCAKPMKVSAKHGARWYLRCRSERNRRIRPRMWLARWGAGTWGRIKKREQCVCGRCGQQTTVIALRDGFAV
jgi:hypothetical protein